MSKHDTAEIRTRVGFNVRLLRESQNLSLRKLSMMVGIDYTRLFAIEHGKANATLSTLSKIADGLGVDIQRLFEPTSKA